MADITPPQFGQTSAPSPAPSPSPSPSAPAAASTPAHAAWSDWLARPENKAGLINFGLQMMQPVGFGQTPIGAAAQSVGAGFEAHDRNLAENQSEVNKSRALDIEQQRSDAYTTAANNKGGLDVKDLFRSQREDEKDFMKFADAEAKNLFTQNNDPLNTKPDPVYAGKTQLEIRDFILKDKTQKQKLMNSYNTLKGAAGEATGQSVGPTTGSEPQQTQMSTAEVTHKYAKEWAALKAAMASPDPNVRAAAQQNAARLRPLVSDPEVWDQMLGGTPAQ